MGKGWEKCVKSMLKGWEKYGKSVRKGRKKYGTNVEKCFFLKCEKSVEKKCGKSDGKVWVK